VVLFVIAKNEERGSSRAEKQSLRVDINLLMLALSLYNGGLTHTSSSKTIMTMKKTTPEENTG
jgi:hypothetical protein